MKKIIIISWIVAEIINLFIGREINLREKNEEKSECVIEETLIEEENIPNTIYWEDAAIKYFD